jgi:hypothetical protein
MGGMRPPHGKVVCVRLRRVHLYIKGRRGGTSGTSQPVRGAATAELNKSPRKGRGERRPVHARGQGRRGSARHGWRSATTGADGGGGGGRAIFAPFVRLALR